MTKVYILAYDGGDLEDIQMTLDFEKAMRWLEKANDPQFLVLEYHLDEAGIQSYWHTMWYIIGGKIASQLS